MLEIKLGQKETRKNIFIWNDKKKQEIVEDNPPDASSPIPSVVVRGARKCSWAVRLLGEVHLWGNIMKSWIIVLFDDDDDDGDGDDVGDGDADDGVQLLGKNKNTI